MKPLISVVTVCFNAVKDIEKTILSVINQTYENIEYIIIDGGSTDGTVDVIKKYADRITYWMSEPDKGIYDAMNKGIKVATGEWINFMNAGDCFYNNNVVSAVFCAGGLPDKIEADIVYGYQIHTFPFGKYVRKKLPFEVFRQGMPIGHPSSFVRTELMKSNMFDLRFKIAADYNFFYHQWIAGRRFLHVNVIVADFEASQGVSSNTAHKFLTMRETAIINGSYATARYYKAVAIVRIKLMVKRVIKWVIGKGNYQNLLKSKRDIHKEYIPLINFLEGNYASNHSNHTSV